MATLNPGNIVNGNTIQTSDLLQLYKAFGTGSGDSITGLAMTGSLNGDASTATTATTATSASNITTAITGGGTHYLTFVNGAGTRAPKIASLLEYTANTNTLQVTASRAVTASYALNAASSPNTVNVTPQGLSSRAMYPIAGFAAFNGVGTPTSASVNIGTEYPSLPSPSILGTDIWVTANADQDPNPSITVTYVGGNLIFYASDPGYGGNVVFTGYIQQ